jgi:DHA3 family tetracycline resistance protein-like MFS transporter
MIAANLLRALAALAIGLLAVAGSVEIWHLILLSVVFGMGEALFGPSFTAIVPEIVPEHLLVQANSLDQAMRPLAMQFLGPALGGALVASVGPGSAFLFDAATLLFAALMLTLMRTRTAARAPAQSRLLEDMRDGARYVRTQVWLWATLLGFSVAVLVFWGPIEVLVPYLVKNDIGGGAGGFGLVLAAGGAGAILAAVTISVVGLPARRLGLVYAAFIVAGYGTALYGVAQALWQMAVIAALAGACFSAGLVAWSTTMQSRVPTELLGRVSSLDWMVSISLLPVSFAVVGPVSRVLGVRETLILAGTVAGTILLLVLAAVPELRQPEPEAA